MLSVVGAEFGKVLRWLRVPVSLHSYYSAMCGGDEQPQPTLTLLNLKPPKPHHHLPPDIHPSISADAFSSIWLMIDFGPACQLSGLTIDLKRSSRPDTRYLRDHVSKMTLWGKGSPLLLSNIVVSLVARTAVLRPRLI